MNEYVAHGLPADWLNAWLAAIGVTVLVPDARLAWSDDPLPKARLTWPGDDHLPALITANLPSTRDLENLAIAGLPQNMTLAQYQAAAATAREQHDLSLAVLTTDLAEPNAKGTLPTGPFNVGAPRGETLFTRLSACRRALNGDQTIHAQIEATLEGRSRRHKLNGLGFDYRRIAASVPGEAEKLVDPVIECLCFFGLLLHPIGGNGTRLYQRGWSRPAPQRRAFCWPAWRYPLDRWAIDALLDAVYPTSGALAASAAVSRVELPPNWRRLGVTGLYGSVSFRRTGSSDPTRGYGTERLA